MRIAGSCFFMGCFLWTSLLQAQNYQAISGSVHAGSLAVAVNPASIVHVPYAWDFTPFSVQLKHSTNAFIIENFSLLSSPANIEVAAVNGTKKRFVFANQDIHLFNTRISLNSNAAVAFGANLQNYFHTTTSNANWQDTSFTLANFMSVNTGNLPLSASATGSAWGELYGSYAQTIYADDFKTLNMGITLRLSRAIAGGYALAANVGYVPLPYYKPAFTLNSGSLQYGYSANFDRLDSSKSSSENRKAFLQDNRYSLGADVGFEYIVMARQDINAESEALDEYAYTTKIGVSITGLGGNKYAHSSRSRLGIAGRPGITDTLLESRFQAVRTVDAFNDSLETVAAVLNPSTGDFYIYQPTRFIINIDQHISGDFFVNAGLTLPVLPVVAKNTLHIRDMNLLAITPRWETKTMGVYFPLLLNNKKQLWLGGAFKLGPLLMGTHNLANLFSKNKMHNGGGYLALTFRAGKKYDRQAHLPGGKLSGAAKRALGCPRF